MIYLDKILLFIFKKSIGIFIFFLIFWGAFLFFSGTISSGFRLAMDDIGIIELNNSIHLKGGWNTLINYLITDLHIRFKPVFNIHFVLETKIFGINFVAWSIYTGLLGILTSFFIFKFAIKIGISYFYAFAFTFLSLVGLQSELWWRTDDSESLSLFLFSIALFFQSRTIFDTPSTTNRTSYITFIILFVFCKESFVLLLPGFFLLHVWLYKIRNNATFLDSLLKHWKLSLAMGCLAILELSIIIFYVGTNKIGYAGIDTHSSIKTMINEFFLSFNLTPFLFFTIALFTGFILFFYNILINKNFSNRRAHKNDINSFLQFFIPHIVICLIFILPQHILYAKSGFTQRYLIPVMMWYAFMVCFFYNFISENHFLKKAQENFLKISLLLLMSIVFRHSILHANVYAEDGRKLDMLFTEITSQTSDNDTILLVLDAQKTCELNTAMQAYSERVGKERNNRFLYIYNNENEKDQFLRDLTKKCIQSNKGHFIEDLKDTKNIKYIVIFPSLFDYFKNNNMWFVDDNFTASYIRDIKLMKRKK